jgi:hypothetical protein
MFFASSQTKSKISFIGGYGYLNILKDAVDLVIEHLRGLGCHLDVAGRRVINAFPGPSVIVLTDDLAVPTGRHTFYLAARWKWINTARHFRKDSYDGIVP